METETRKRARERETNTLGLERGMGTCPRTKVLLEGAGDGGVATGAKRSILALLTLGQSNCFVEKARSQDFLARKWSLTKESRVT